MYPSSCCPRYVLGSTRLSPWSAVLHPVHDRFNNPCGPGCQARRVSSRIRGQHTAVPALCPDKLQRALNAAARVITGTRKFDRGLGSLQARSDSSPVSERPRTTVLSEHCIPVSSAVLTRGGICVPPTVTYLPYRVSGSTLTAVGRSQLLVRWPGTLSSTDYFRRLLKRTCSRDTSAPSAKYTVGQKSRPQTHDHNSVKS